MSTKAQSLDKVSIKRVQSGKSQLAIESSRKSIFSQKPISQFVLVQHKKFNYFEIMTLNVFSNIETLIIVLSCSAVIKYSTDTAPLNYEKNYHKKFINNFFSLSLKWESGYFTNNRQSFHLVFLDFLLDFYLGASF